MNLSHLIEEAARAAGGKKQLAAELNKHPSRISEWVAGRQKPDAHELAFMAARAGLPVLETVAEVEAELDPRYSSIWRAALGKLRAAGVAAGASGAVVLSAALTGGLVPEKASASTGYAHGESGSSSSPRYTLSWVMLHIRRALHELLDATANGLRASGVLARSARAVAA